MIGMSEDIKRAYVDTMLAWLQRNGRWWIDDTPEKRGRLVSPWYYDGAEPFVWAAETHPRNDGIFTDADLDCLDEPFDMRIVNLVPPESRANDGNINLLRAREVSPQEVRGRIKQFRPHPVIVTSTWPEKSAQRQSVYGWAGPRNWQWMESGRFNVEPFDPPIGGTARIPVLIGMQFRYRYFWRVYLAHDQQPGISIVTDVWGVREVFRLRDLPNGAKRRAALRHWVTEHWAQTPTRDNEHHLVREHLRGDLSFWWNELRCRIIPSGYDVAREKMSKERRQELRDLGQDRRSAPELAAQRPEAG